MFLRNHKINRDNFPIQPNAFRLRGGWLGPARFRAHRIPIPCLEEKETKTPKRKRYIASDPPSHCIIDDKKKNIKMALRRDWVYENNGGCAPSPCLRPPFKFLICAFSSSRSLCCRTCVAIAGTDYCVIAADTRLSVGYSIYTRDYSKICKLYGRIPCAALVCWVFQPGFSVHADKLFDVLSVRLLCRADKCVMASSGFQGDLKALQKNLAARHLVSDETVMFLLL